jgi:hypothetical protein
MIIEIQILFRRSSTTWGVELSTWHYCQQWEEHLKVGKDSLRNARNIDRRGRIKISRLWLAKFPAIWCGSVTLLYPRSIRVKNAIVLFKFRNIFSEMLKLHQKFVIYRLEPARLVCLDGEFKKFMMVRKILQCFIYLIFLRRLIDYSQYSKTCLKRTLYSTEFVFNGNIFGSREFGDGIRVKYPGLNGNCLTRKRKSK